MLKRERKNVLPSKTVRWSLAKGRDRTAHPSNKVGNHSKIALFALSSRDIRLSSKDLNLVGSD